MAINHAGNHIQRSRYKPENYPCNVEGNNSGCRNNMDFPEPTCRPPSPLSLCRSYTHYISAPALLPETWRLDKRPDFAHPLDERASYLAPRLCACNLPGPYTHLLTNKNKANIWDVIRVCKKNGKIVDRTGRLVFKPLALPKFYII